MCDCSMPHRSATRYLYLSVFTQREGSWAAVLCFAATCISSQLCTLRLQVRELMVEVERPSARAGRSITSATLAQIERDAAYDESQLSVKFEHGSKAAKAYDRDGAFFMVFFITPASIVSAMVNSAGSSAYAGKIVATTLHLGSTILLLGIMPDDRRILRKLLTALVVIAGPFGVAYHLRSATANARSFWGRRGICIDNRGQSVPCWHAVLRMIMFTNLAPRCPLVRLCDPP